MLEVCIVARISGCQNQKEDSLDDQIDRGKQAVADLYDGPVNFHCIATKGKGERLDREELAEVEQLLRSRTIDLLFVEDLGRLVRGTEAARLLGLAVDHGTRGLSPNDMIDTWDSTWEEDAISACRDHVSHNSQTSKRLKFKMMNRFLKNGASTPLVTVAYVLSENPKTFADWRKNPAVERHIIEGFRLLSESLNCSAVADWFNREGVPVGRYCRRKSWDRHKVRRMYTNTMLKGKPGRGFKVTVKNNEKGIRKSVKNPEGPKYVAFPHLAYFSEEEFDDLNRRLKEAHAKNRRKRVDGNDPRLNVPRTRTRFPGQHATCWYCGRQFVWGGNGAAGTLMCGGARNHVCWNSVAFKGSLAATNLVAAIVAQLNQLPGFQEQFASLVRNSRDSPENEWQKQSERLERDERELGREKANLLDAIGQCGSKPMLLAKIEELEERERTILFARVRLNLLKKEPIEIPNTVAEICDLLTAEFARLANTSTEFNDLMRKLVPEFSVYLVRLCDGGHLLPRARVKLNLGGCIPGIAHVPDVQQFLERELDVDLFVPPQRARIRVDAIALSAQLLSPGKIAMQLDERPEAMAVYNAIALHRRMLELKLTEPYIKIFEPPADYTKLKRYKNLKYHFAPLEGYQPPPI